MLIAKIKKEFYLNFTGNIIIPFFWLFLQVSWIRRKKDRRELLTVNLQTYASAERFQDRHFQHSEDWTLEIKYVQKRDDELVRVPRFNPSTH